MHKTKSGFTIVELLIVIVVIAILATISVVAYTGVQEHARKSHLMNDIANIKKAMEMYRVDNGDYPICPIITPPTQPSECQYNNGASHNIRAQLSSYASSLGTHSFNYVHSPNTEQWGMRYISGSAPYNITVSGNCKFGVNMTASWYSSAPECTW